MPTTFFYGVDKKGNPVYESSSPSGKANPSKAVVASSVSDTEATHPYIDQITQRNAPPAKSTVNDGIYPEGTQFGNPQGQAGTLNATITPTSKIKVPAPAVVTSSAAEKDLADKKAQTDQFVADTQQHQSLVSAPQQTSSIPQQGMSLEDQIFGSLGGLSDANEQIDHNTDQTIAPIQDAREEAQRVFDKQATFAIKQLNNIARGTYPLSPAEQSLLTSTEQIYTATIDAQKTANDAYTGQMSELLASLGINTSAPTQALGMIHATITSGNQRVAELNSQMSQSLANLTLGFQRQDYDLVFSAWEEKSKFLEQRITTLADMEKSVADAAKQQKQDIRDFTELTLSYIMKSADFTETQKEHAIQNAISWGNLAEEKRHNLVTEGTNGPGGGNFTSAQIKVGAANAGVPIESFQAWSADTKNLFINGDVKGTKKTIDAALGSSSLSEVESGIKDLGLPADAEAYFLDYARGADSGASTNEKKQQAFADTFRDLQGQDYDRGEAYKQVTDEWSDGGDAPITKADQKVIDAAFREVYGSRPYGPANLFPNLGRELERPGIDF